MKININKLDHVQICIPFDHEDQARDFYSRILGLQEIEKPDSLKSNGGLWYKIGDIELHIGAEEMGSYKSKRHPAFQVEELQEVRSYLEISGISTFDEKPIPLVERFSFYDPFGNRIEFLQRTN
ncbi:catechol 2,3-dioxygenase-like lactoylglutathione lyase family enzyme [Bacillus mesophilus]|uniref:Glyoxalase n=1 Tax=Bacillus mesophilus TaxID=1808955 RepID=A0A6M0Q2L2_9BACI|nr:VOC family protein [Bacillus mesophilus]MBM7659550.1 catechol 2,3-dioxygenase-like lactoylglutathione lyase family enzyme [Bacillus mesophilus]NEY70422.1 glyoxalase [Bacillus mesophilus]